MRSLTRLGVGAASLALSMLFVAACGSGSGSESAEAADEIRIGVIVARTGPYADYGRGEEIAARLAAEELNAAGGINGTKVTLVIRDEAGKPDQAISVARELMEHENVDVLLGPGLTTTALAAFPIINEVGVPAISPSIVDPTAAPKNRPWTFTIGAPADILFPANYPTIASAYPDVKRVALAYDPACGGCLSESTFMADYLEEQGVEVVNKSNPVSITTKSADLGAQASAISALKPDALVGSASPGDWGRLALALKQQGLSIPAFSGTGPSAPEFVKTAGAAGDGWTVLSAFWDENPDPQVSKFVDAMTPELQEADIFGGQVNSAHALYYDAVNVVAAALKANPIEEGSSLADRRAAIRDGIQGLSAFTGVGGEMSMQEDGRMKIAGYVLALDGDRFVRLGS